MITYVKIGAVVLAVLLLFGAGFYVGDLSGKAKVAELTAGQAKAVETALLNQQSASAAYTAHLNQVIASYENTPIDPIAVSIGSRVFKYASTSCGTVPKAPAVTPGVSDPSPISRSPATVELATSDAFAACSHDANLVIALQQAWPR